MEHENIYPVIRRPWLTAHAVRHAIRCFFIFSALVCVIVNLAVGGTPWSVLVAGGLLLAWVLFFNKPLVENTFLTRLTYFMLYVCLYLAFVDRAVGNGWARLVVPIVAFSLLILQSGIIVISGFQPQKRNIMPLYSTLGLSLLYFLAALQGLFPINWAVIVLASLTFFIFIVAYVAFARQVSREFKKRFHRD